MQRIDEMTEPPIVGRFYLVPTVRYKWGSSCIAEWPVIGPKHEDRAHLDFPYIHYHVDVRFLSGRYVLPYVHYRSLDDHVASLPISEVIAEYGSIPPLIYKRRRCFRAATIYPLDKAGASPNFRRLFQAYASSCLVRGEHGWICPHRGAPLGSIAPDEHGIITCPLHGLRWRADTGEAAFPEAAHG